MKARSSLNSLSRTPLLCTKRIFQNFQKTPSVLAFFTRVKKAGFSRISRYSLMAKRKCRPEESRRKPDHSSPVSQNRDKSVICLVQAVSWFLSRSINSLAC